MRHGQRVGVVIPALDEEASIGLVIDAIPAWVDDIVVVDNGSTDATASTARAHGARVVPEPRRGYGAACQTGIEALAAPNVVVFLDGDFSDHPSEMQRLVDPIAAGDADFVVGARHVADSAQGAISWWQRSGNRLACALMRRLWAGRYTDLGPFRAIRSDALEALQMRDKGFGWTVEMQIKAIRRSLRVREVPTDYRKRIGRSKISGTLRGAIGAGAKILLVILVNAVQSVGEKGRGRRALP